MEVKHASVQTDEEFCSRYEKTFYSGFTNGRFVERWLPGLVPGKIEDEHVERYKFAAAFVENKSVLDIACGTGFGSFHLAKEGKAANVIACDIDEEAIRYGNCKYRHEKIQRCIADAELFSSPGNFDVVISFETIEHLKDYRRFMQNMQMSLKPEGLFIVSTPVVMQTTTNNDNPHHVIEWSFADFQTLVAEYFSIKDIYVQNIELAQSRPDIFNRIVRKIKNYLAMGPTTRKIGRLELYSQQFNPASIIRGFQVLVCEKKQITNE